MVVFIFPVSTMSSDVPTEADDSIAMGLNRVIRCGYELLALNTYFTAGVQEVRAWT